MVSCPAFGHEVTKALLPGKVGYEQKTADCDSAFSTITPRRDLSWGV